MCFCRIQTSPFCIFPTVVCGIPYVRIIGSISKRIRFGFDLSSTDFSVNCINSTTFVCETHSVNLFYKLRILAHQSCLNTIHKEVSRCIFSQSFCFRCTIHNSSIDNYVIIYVFIGGLPFILFIFILFLSFARTIFSVILLLALALFALTVLVEPPPFAIIFCFFCKVNILCSRGG